MERLCTPDKRLRIDLALRERGREAEQGMPCLRVRLDRRVMLNWSPLAPDVPSVRWRYAGAATVRTLSPFADDLPAQELVVRFASADDPAAAFAVTLRCAGTGVACRTRPDVPPCLRWPRETQGVVVSPAAPSGFARLSVAQALADEAVRSATLLYAHGKCAALRRGTGGWLLIAADRPADLPANRVRGWLAEGLAELDTGEPARALAPSAAATFNCHLPFVVTPVLTVPQPMAWAAPRLEGVTAAHGAALQRLRALEWRDAEVRWIRGEIGEYVLAARRRNDSWQVSALTAKSRVWTIRLPFLDAGRRYRAIWQHDPQPARQCFVPLPDVVDAASRPFIHLAESGGFTLDLEPLESGREA